MSIYTCYQTVFSNSCSEILKINLCLLLIMDKFGTFGINNVEKATRLKAYNRYTFSPCSCGQKE